MKQRKKISPETKDYYNSIYWLGIIGLRNIISHEYEDIRLMIIYEIAATSIPELLQKIKNTI